MAELQLSSIFELVERANQQGILISLRDDELIIKFSRSKDIDPHFLAELKHNKERLKEYFSKSSRFKPGSDDMEADSILYEGKPWYELAPVQQWWVDDSQDATLKKNQNGLFSFKITGAGFDPAVLQQAVLHIVQRHESLRSVFRKIGDKYYMGVIAAGEDVFKIDYTDLRGRNNLLGQLISLQIDFDLQKGPLFATRLYQTADTEYYFSMLIHHVVYDSWSFDVLRHDLFTAYLFCSEGRTPVLPPMKFQYKEYMSLMNRYIKKYEVAHKEYWEKLYPHLPEELIIPGVKQTFSGEHHYENLRIAAFLSGEVIDQLHLIASKYQTGLFIVIQSLFKLYLREITRQNDIVICMQGFGRDILMDAEDQIGVYATTSIIRTVFSGDEDLEQTIRKVKKSNEDMHTYAAYTLLDTFESRVAPEERKLSSFSKFTLDYMDSNGFYGRNENTTTDTPQVTDMDIMPLSEHPKKYVINTDMKCFFMYLNDQMDFRIIYDADLYESPVMEQFIEGLKSHITFIANHLPI
jgi:hypothetical protein